MTAKQESLYWREWAAVHRADVEADRHVLHAFALGADKSHKLFTNADFDKVLGAFRAISQPTNVRAQLRQQNQDRTRLLWKICNEQSALLAVFLSEDAAERRARAENYIVEIIRGKFHTDLITDLSVPQLTQLRATLAARINTLRGNHTTYFDEAELRHLAGLGPHPTPTEAPEDQPPDEVLEAAMAGELAAADNASGAPY